MEKALPVNDRYFEDTMLQGFLIGYAKISLEDKFDLIKKYVPKIDSWAICDSFCTTLKFKELELPKVWDFIVPFAKSNEEFTVRFHVVLIIDNFIIDDYVDRVIKLLDSIKLDKYYVQMAVAWAIAEIGTKYFDKAMSYLKGKNNLDKFTYNKALQKMIESYKIDSDTKANLKSMKIK